MLTFSLNKTTTDVMGKVATIDCATNSDLGRQWLSEIYFNSLDGRVNDNVNVTAYGYACEQNTKMVKQKREVNLITVDEAADGVKGIADVVASYIDNNIDSLIEASEFKYQMEQFIEMRDYLLIEEGVALDRLILQAKRANEKAIKRLRDLITDYHLEDMVKAVLENSNFMNILGGVVWA